eukprot:TRINITY_DN17347_c0_g1_i1.p1 TRINITY_DN17347_c0_g1~~TRINITY_DN17347_c0_g1_i1.p1  ORF type:complete len:469 (-),score=96.49 TRINITY_DN17347_c0_g1_i1:375-1703(-)
MAASGDHRLGPSRQGDIALHVSDDSGSWGGGGSMNGIGGELGLSNNMIARGGTSACEGSSGAEDVFLCTICCEVLVEPRMLSCGHSFCALCLDRWLRQKASCPLCNCCVTATPMRNITLEHVISQLKPGGGIPGVAPAGTLPVGTREFLGSESACEVVANTPQRSTRRRRWGDEGGSGGCGSSAPATRRRFLGNALADSEEDAEDVTSLANESSVDALPTPPSPSLSCGHESASSAPGAHAILHLATSASNWEVSLKRPSLSTESRSSGGEAIAPSGSSSSSGENTLGGLALTNVPGGASENRAPSQQRSMPATPESYKSADLEFNSSEGSSKKPGNAFSPFSAEGLSSPGFLPSSPDSEGDGGDGVAASLPPPPSSPPPASLAPSPLAGGDDGYAGAISSSSSDAEAALEGAVRSPSPPEMASWPSGISSRSYSRSRSFRV